MDAVNEFIAGSLIDHNYDREALAIQITLDKREQTPIYWHDYRHTIAPPRPRVLAASRAPSHSGLAASLVDFDEEELARQLTLVEFAIFRNIRLAELIKTVWAKARTNHQSPNVLRLVDRFNQVSQWTIAEIVTTARLDDRVAMMEKLIKVAHKLLGLQNYNSAMAIVAGLNNAPILRLKHTKARLAPAAVASLEDAERFFRNQRNYLTYRAALRAATPPCLPYFGMYLQDLTFVWDGNDTFVDEAGTVVNFEKCGLTAAVMADLRHFQRVPYNFEPVETIQKMLASFPHFTDEELYGLSLSREPRGASLKDVM